MVSVKSAFKHVRHVRMYIYDVVGHVVLYHAILCCYFAPMLALLEVLMVTVACT